MNVRYGFTLWLSLSILSFFSACVKEDTKKCISASTGIHIHFYSLSPCQTDTVYPVDMTDLIVSVFDNEGILVAYHKDTSVEWQQEYIQKIEVPGGLYTVIAWSGLQSESFHLQEPVIGQTTKSDLLFRLKRTGTTAYSIAGEKIWYGESPAVYIPENKGSEPMFEEVSVNMQEITNRLTISVEGLNTDDVEMLIESANGSMNMDGTVAEDEIITYQPQYVTNSTFLEACFTTLTLTTGQTHTLIIRNKTQGTELYSGSLLGTLLLKNLEVNLACDHDFVISFTAEDACECGIYIILEIRVNDWLVHSYQTQV
ncbi:MAG: FimB/Mfa2 family fimbrial subunit [Tannerellaceae bacterium]|nr:FimB/Mfa2 family fimbrial subunit [Tannerellaceae bacterium]